MCVQLLSLFHKNKGYIRVYNIVFCCFHSLTWRSFDKHRTRALREAKHLLFRRARHDRFLSPRPYPVWFSGSRHTRTQTHPKFMIISNRSRHSAGAVATVRLPLVDVAAVRRGCTNRFSTSFITDNVMWCGAMTQTIKLCVRAHSSVRGAERMWPSCTYVHRTTRANGSDIGEPARSYSIAV